MPFVTTAERKECFAEHMSSIALKQQLAARLAAYSGEDKENIFSWFETPPQPEMGDLAFPCFRLSRRLKKSPKLIAEALVEELSGSFEQVGHFEAQSGYLNVFYDQVWFARSVLSQSLAEGDRPGSSVSNCEKPVLVEFSSPNIAKVFHVGHAFTTVLGQAIANLFEYKGYKVVRLNHLGDYGTQFGKLIVAYTRWGDEKKLASDPIGELQRVYIRFHQELEFNPELEDAGREAFARLERGDEEAVFLWQKFRDESLKVFNRTYNRLGISFDNMNGESFYSDKIPALLTWLRSLDLLSISEGAVVVELEEENLTPCLLIKSDGSSIYASRDLAAIRWRDETYDFDRCIYVVGLPQEYHFRQVFAVMKKAGFKKADRLQHVGFGTVKFGEEKFSTREGNVIPLETLLDESVAKTAEIIRLNNPKMSDDEVAELAEKIGVSAVRFIFLKNGREKDIAFSWDEMLDFEGDTAPYLLYAVARCHSVLNKAANQGLAPAEKITDEICAVLTDGESRQILHQIDDFSQVLDEALSVAEPSIFLRHALALARAFNRFYQHHSILFAEDKMMKVGRLTLLDAVRRTLEAAAEIAGLAIVRRM